MSAPLRVKSTSNSRSPPKLPWNWRSQNIKGFWWPSKMKLAPHPFEKQLAVLHLKPAHPTGGLQDPLKLIHCEGNWFNGARPEVILGFPSALFGQSLAPFNGRSLKILSSAFLSEIPSDLSHGSSNELC